MHSISLLAKIRNNFAHKADVKTFDHKLVRSYLFSFDAKLIEQSCTAFDAARRVYIEEPEYHERLISIENLNNLLLTNCRFRFTVIFISIMLSVVLNLTFQPVAQRFATDISVVRDFDLADKEVSVQRNLIHLLLDFMNADDNGTPHYLK